MAASAGADLADVEARLRALLTPYEASLEWATIYGLPTLRKRGAKGHEWFAFVKPAAKHVSLFLLPVHALPSVAAAVPPLLASRLTGKATFNFRALSAEEETALAQLLEVAFRAYMAA